MTHRYCPVFESYTGRGPAQSVRCDYANRVRDFCQILATWKRVLLGPRGWQSDFDKYFAILRIAGGGEHDWRVARSRELEIGATCGAGRGASHVRVRGGRREFQVEGSARLP